MVNTCIAYNCGLQQSKECTITFHQFPLSNPELCSKWVQATRWENFEPKKHDRICRNHFTPEDFYFADSKKPKPDAVPSIFEFPGQSFSRSPSNIGTKRKLPASRSIPSSPKKLPKISVPPISIKRKSPTKDELRRKIKTLQQKVRRKEKKIENLKGLLDDLVKRQLLSEDVSSNLEKSFSGLPLAFIKNYYNNKNRSAKGYRHNDEVKRFAMTLNFYSPKAYDYVRSVFKTLPHPSSMANWTSSIKCDPGFFEDVFREIKSKTERKRHQRDVTLICDAMKISSEIEFNNQTRTFEGFVDFGDGLILADDQEDTPAKDALVFMLTSLRGNWKYPVGYVLIDGIDANTLHALLSRALDLCAQYEIDVQALTMDGTSTNFSAMKKFGCKVAGKLDSMTGKFFHPAFKHPIFFIPDAVHMLKLGRNALADLGLFADEDNNMIEWRFITALHDVQEEEGLKFGNKISVKHIEFERNKMSVKLAAQVLSSSVADSIDFLREAGDPRFQNSEGTVKFIRIIDCAFDLLNSRNPHGKGYKKPLRLIEKEQWFSTVEKSINYLHNLQDENGTRLMSHRRNTFVKGLIIALKSVKELAMLLLTRPVSPFSYVLTYKFSQDHLELLFSCIRSSGGFNNNPNVTQFKAALKRILVRTSIKGSKYGNCTNLEPECTEPLFKLEWKKRKPEERDNQDGEEDVQISALCDVFDQENRMTYYKENILAHIGGFVVRKLLKIISCKVCVEALLERENRNIYYLNLINIKDNGGLIVPSSDVVQIVKKCESYFNAYVTGGDDRISRVRNIKEIVAVKIRRDLFTNNVFKNLLEHDFENCSLTDELHSTTLTKLIIDKFLKIRFFRYGQRYTLKNLKERILYVILFHLINQQRCFTICLQYKKAVFL